MVKVPADFVFSPAFLFSSVIYKAHSSVLHQKLTFILSDRFHPPRIQSSVPLPYWFYHSDKLPLRENEGSWDTFTVQGSALLPGRVNFLDFSFQDTLVPEEWKKWGKTKQMPSEQKWINNWKTRRRKAEADFLYIYIKSKGCQLYFFKNFIFIVVFMLLECFSYEPGKPFFPWILPPFSPRTFEFPLEKKGKKFCLFPHPKWFVNKEERMVPTFVFWLSWRLWLKVGLTWEWKELFLVGNFVYESSLCEGSCSFMSFPRGTCLLGGASCSCLSLVWHCHLHFSANGCSLGLQDGARLGWTELLWALRAQAGGVLGAWPPCREPAVVAGVPGLCLTLTGLVGPWSGLTFFPASGSNLFTPSMSLRLLPLFFYETECQESAGCCVAMFELLEL